MTKYWPVAILENGEKQFTYDYVLDITEAIEIFNIWSDKFNIKKAWIDVDDGDGSKLKRRIMLKRSWNICDE